MKPTTGRAFTLVELLVVIGIIAVLTAILMPALRRVRESADLAACLSNLRQIGNASLMHANEHRGFYPFAGQVGDGTSDATPAGLNDASRRKYTYYTDNTGRTRPAPYPAAVAPYLGFKIDFDNETALLDSVLSPTGVRKIFTCPSSEGQTPLGHIVGSAAWLSNPKIYSDYAFNEAFLGYGWRPPGPDTWHIFIRHGGQMNKIRHPSQVVVGFDGQPNEWNWLMVWNWSTGLVTLRDAYLQTGPAGQATNFNAARHNRRLNALFVDGHAETLQMNTTASARGDLDRAVLQHAQ